MNRIFVTGDTHGGQIGDLDKLSSRRFPINNELTKNDYVIILGDFGFIFDASKNYSKTEQYYHKWFEEKNWTTLFIGGNHENYNKIYKLPEIEMFAGKVRKLNDSIFYLQNGQTYTINKRTFFVMGGGYSFDKNRRVENRSWWQQEMPSNEDYFSGLLNLGKVGYKVDYVLSHTCSHFEFKELKNIFHEFNSYKNSHEEDPLRDYLQYVLQQVDYKRHYFAHMHKDHVDKKWSILYNRVIELGGQDEDTVNI